VDQEAQKAAKYKYTKLTQRIERINSLRRLKSVLELAATGDKRLAVTGDEWNADPWSIQADDLLIDLKTGEARPGLPSDFINKAAPTKWKGLDEPAVAWRMFLHQIFNSDQSLVGYLQRVFGSALVGKPSQQEFYILWGPEGRNGKGTILETLKEVLGNGLASSIRSEMIMESRQSGGNGADPELLDLQGKRIVWTSETGDGKRLNTEKMKLFTGGDTLSSRYNYSNEMISFKPTHSLFMLTNHKPRIGAGDAAVWSRLRLIPFLLSFVDEPAAKNERKKDPDLQERLLKEASGILTWLVQGCLDWQKNGINPPQTVTEAGNEYRLDENPLQQFINDCCHVGTGHKVQAGKLHEAFTKWFAATYGEKASVPSQRKISEQLQKTTGIMREKGKPVYFHGLSLAAEGHTTGT
jgi:putative DNA primase/helicase